MEDERNVTSDERERVAGGGLFEDMAARAIDGPVENGLICSAFREPPADAKAKARYLTAMAPHYFALDAELLDALRAIVIVADKAWIRAHNSQLSDNTSDYPEARGAERCANIARAAIAKAEHHDTGSRLRDEASSKGEARSGIQSLSSAQDGGGE